MKACIFLNGTSATSVKTPKGYFQEKAHKFMYDKNNIITELFENCTEPAKLNLDGPGTDLFTEYEEYTGHWLGHAISTVFTTLRDVAGSAAGTLSGNRGANNIWSNLGRVKDFIFEQCQNLPPGEKLELEVFGWSRGAYTALLVQQAIKEMQAAGEINADIQISLNIHAIDPVPGGPDDRMYLPKDAPNDNLKHCNVYYSDTGNLREKKLPPVASTIIPNFRKFASWTWSNSSNMPFFSALNVKSSPSSKVRKLLFKADHEAIAGKARDETDTLDSYVGDIVLADIVASASAHQIEFNLDWKKRVLAKGEDSLKKYIEAKPDPARDRLFLDPSKDPSESYQYYGKALSTLMDMRVVGEGPDEDLFENGERINQPMVKTPVDTMYEKLADSKKQFLSSLSVSILPGLSKLELVNLYEATQKALTDPASPLRNLCKKTGFFRKYSSTLTYGETGSYKDALKMIENQFYEESNAKRDLLQKVKSRLFKSHKEILKDMRKELSEEAKVDDKPKL